MNLAQLLNLSILNFITFDEVEERVLGYKALAESLTTPENIDIEYYLWKPEVRESPNLWTPNEMELSSPTITLNVLGHYWFSIYVCEYTLQWKMMGEFNKESEIYDKLVELTKCLVESEDFYRREIGNCPKHPGPPKPDSVAFALNLLSDLSKNTDKDPISLAEELWPDLDWSKFKK